VLADGAQAAFVAGAVAELARRGASWDRGVGAGLGAHVALLALLGEATEAERRWAREAALGCPMFESRLGAARRRFGESRGLTLLPDAWSLDGWLDPAGLAEHLAPEMAAAPQRLAQRGATLVVVVEDLTRGAADRVDLATLEAKEAGAVLRAAAAFPAGWGPESVELGGATRLLWGGVGLVLRGAAPWAADPRGWDVVCGFPVPAVARPALGGALVELIQRRSEASTAAVVERWVDGAKAGSLRVIAPTESAWRAFSGRHGADLGVEYPMPWERNGELAGAAVRFGAFTARTVGARTGG
jgi:predicted acylesterase/phospholipase RssA